MAIRDDVLVIGGGIAGVASAIAAAETGAKTRLVTHKESTLRNASGLVDVLGYTPDGDGPLANPFDALADLPDEHPYSKVGENAVRAGMDLFDDAVGDLYQGGHTDHNALVPTHGGTVKPTARYPVGTAAGLASDDRNMLLVGFENVTAFDAPLAAEHLEAAGVPFDVRGVTVEFPKRFPADAEPTRYARALDRNEPVDDDTVREALATKVGGYLGSEGRVGLPALLGDDRAAEVRTELEAALGVDVFEIPMGPPSLLGMRLEDALYDAAREAGVRVTSGHPIVDYEGNGRVEQVVMDRMGSRAPYEAAQYVLATGGAISGGIESDREGVEEPVFGLSVPHPEDRYDWFVDDVWGDHPYTKFGVVVDDDLRPVDADQNVQFENLRAAGSVIGGYDFAAEKSGSGVSLATGYAAGTAAGEGI